MAKVAQHVMSAPKSTPTVTVGGSTRVTSNQGSPTVKINGSTRPTKSSNGGSGRH